MPGSLVRDALAPTLLNSTNLTATATGTAVEVNRPTNVKAYLKVTGTVSGTSPTLNVELQSSDDATFATGVVSHGRFAQVSSTNQDRFLQADIQNRYARAVATVAGTTPSFGSVVLTLEEEHFRRGRLQTA